MHRYPLYIALTCTPTKSSITSKFIHSPFKCNFPLSKPFQKIMASPLLLNFVCLAMMCMILGTPLANAALSCGQIQLTAAPCIAYVRSPGGAVPGPCCNGLRTLNSEASTTPDRQGACRCLKSTVLSLPGVNYAALAGLPGKCGINLPYKVTPSIDCNK